MHKETITYTDYEGNERTEDFYFNLTKGECAKWQLSVNGGLDKHINKIIESKDQAEVIKMFDEIIKRSYGEKSLDGRRFHKGVDYDLYRAFSETEAYSELVIKLLSNAEAAATFINNIIPKIEGASSVNS